MGFGTLFIGFLFLLNISYFAYTDILAGLILLSALIRLSPYHSHFRLASTLSAVFSVYALVELVLSLCTLFGMRPLGDTASLYLGMPRYALLCLISLTVFSGIRALAREVDAREVAARARLTGPALAAIWLIRMLAELPALSRLLGSSGTVIFYFAVTLVQLALLAIALMLLYRTYMVICLPEDADMPERPSRFAFVREHEQRVEERNRAYAEQQREKLRLKNKNEKKKNNKR